MNQYKNSKNNVRRIAMTGMMIAISILMTYTPFGTVRLVAVEATIAHLPTIILAIVEGPVCGLIAGTAMGIVSMIYSITMPATALSPFIANPLVSILPRIFIGLFSYYAYVGLSKAMKGTKAGQIISVAVGSAVGSITNTVGVLGMLYVVYAKDLFQALIEFGMAQETDALAQTVMAFLVGIASVQGVVEMLVIAFLGTLVVLALKRAGYGRKF